MFLVTPSNNNKKNSQEKVSPGREEREVMAAGEREEMAKTVREGLDAYEP